MGRGYRCFKKVAEGRFCYGKVMNAYVREGTPSKWRVVGQVCNRCYAFSPAPPLPSGSGASSGITSSVT